MNKIYTIGFTQKSAKQFFNTLINNKIDILLDIRLNNTSQLMGFSKYPDIEYFLNQMCNINYLYDPKFAPTQNLLDGYKQKKITWFEYEEEFNRLMKERNIEEYIKNKYSSEVSKNICLLCSEKFSDKCHRRLIAEKFSEIFDLEINNL